MIYLTRKEHFNAAHRLYVEEWSEEKNFEVFGKCANKNYHGHNFLLFVTVKGEPDPTTGMVINLKELSKLIQEKVIDKLDHRNLNTDVAFLKNKMPSIENLAKTIWKELFDEIKGAQLHSIKICETENNFVEYLGE